MEATASIGSEFSSPLHVAIIMDGNGRWARARGLPRIAGHKQGAEVVREIVRHAPRPRPTAVAVHDDRDVNRREELSRVAGKYAEQSRIAVRNVRHDGINKLKRMEKDGDLSEDDHRLWDDEVQTITDEHIEKIDEMLETKQTEIMQV